MARDGTIAEIVPLDKYKRLAYTLRVIEAFVRTELMQLPPYEYMLLMYILTHTLLVGKDRITIPLRMILEGVLDTEAKGWVQVPLPMSKRTLMKALKGLKDSRIIDITRNKVIPGYGMTNAASTITVRHDAITRVLAALEAIDGTRVEYPTEGYVPVVPTPEQPD